MEDMKEEVREVSKEHNIDLSNSIVIINENTIIIQTKVEITDKFLDEIREKLKIKKVSIKIGGITQGLIPVVNNWLEIKMEW